MNPVARLLAALTALVLAPALRAETVQVAVAANFTAPMKAIAALFEKETGHQARLAFGSTGKLYAQIRNGAPFEVFLAADEDTPHRLESDGEAVAGSRFTYATGRLVLWSAAPGVVDAQGEVLRRNEFTQLAIAAPKLAPYGAAASQTLASLGLLERVTPKLVQGESIGQTYSFVASGNAPLGFVALSQVYENGRLRSGSAWVVPADLHAPLRQDALLLQRGQANPAARALLGYLKTEPARAVIRAYGYQD
ncbi:MAG: molybdate ABC transporter substrate-binding protein [Ramlibacter sp.]|nr:molybdate ABC transporter substrate-binding protein [Ramlibacter sp.]